MRKITATFLVLVMSISLAACSDMDIRQIMNKDVNQIHKVTFEDGVSYDFFVDFYYTENATHYAKFFYLEDLQAPHVFRIRVRAQNHWNDLLSHEFIVDELDITSVTMSEFLSTIQQPQE